MSSEFDELEEEALQRLSPNNMRILNDSLITLRTHLSNYDLPNIRKMTAIVSFNIAELLDNLPHIKKSYYSDFPQLLAETLTLLKELKDKVEDEDLKSLILEAIEKIESSNILKYYGYPYKYSHPETRGQKYQRIYQEEKAKYLKSLEAREEQDIRQHIKDNLAADLILEAEGGKTTAYQVAKREPWLNVDYMLQKCCEEIKRDLELQKSWDERKKELDKLEAELSKDEKELGNFEQRLLSLATETILRSGKKDE